MYFNLIELFTILITHWVADFAFQNDSMALGKSKKLSSLIAHTTVYSLMWFMPMAILLPLNQALVFCFITFGFHTLTDYVTSKIVSKRFKYESPFKVCLNYKKYIINDIAKINTKQFIIMDVLPSNEYIVKPYNSIPNRGAFTIVGFDQFLHYIQLFGTYYLLAKI